MATPHLTETWRKPFPLSCKIGEHGVYAVVHEEAAVDFEVASGAGTGEAKLSLAVDGEPGVVPVGGSRGGKEGSR